MITTVCLNPSFDRTLETEHCVPGALNRVLTSRTDPGGKGINVALVAGMLGAEARCIGMCGIDGREKLEAMLHGLKVTFQSIPVEGSIRINTKVISDGGCLTEFNEAGPAVTPKQIGDFEGLLEEYAKKSSFLVLTGSMPAGCPPDLYGRWIARSKTRCVLDAGGDVLRLGVSAGPFLIKPNLEELCQAVGYAMETDAQILSAARILLERGARYAIVTLGGDGAWLVCPEHAWKAQPIPVKVSSTVGAGDSLIGAFLASLDRGEDLLEAFRCGVAAATASVMTSGTQLIRTEDYRDLLSQVRIQEV